MKWEVINIWRQQCLCDYRFVSSWQRSRRMMNSKARFGCILTWSNRSRRLVRPAAWSAYTHTTQPRFRFRLSRYSHLMTPFVFRLRACVRGWVRACVRVCVCVCVCVCVFAKNQIWKCSWKLKTLFNFGSPRFQTIPSTGSWPETPTDSLLLSRI